MPKRKTFNPSPRQVIHQERFTTLGQITQMKSMANYILTQKRYLSSCETLSLEYVRSELSNVLKGFMVETDNFKSQV